MTEHDRTERDRREDLRDEDRLIRARFVDNNVDEDRWDAMMQRGRVKQLRHDYKLSGFVDWFVEACDGIVTAEDVLAEPERFLTVFDDYVNRELGFGRYRKPNQAAAS